MLAQSGNYFLVVVIRVLRPLVDAVLQCSPVSLEQFLQHQHTFVPELLPLTSLHTPSSSAVPVKVLFSLLSPTLSSLVSPTLLVLSHQCCFMVAPPADTDAAFGDSNTLFPPLLPSLKSYCVVLRCSPHWCNCEDAAQLLLSYASPSWSHSTSVALRSSYCCGPQNWYTDFPLNLRLQVTNPYLVWTSCICYWVLDVP